MGQQMLVDIFEPDISFEVEESNGGNRSIIGKVRGQFFVPDGYSRNKRYYPRELWEKVLNDEELKEKLKNRRMIGTIGHSSPINDETIAEGKISHVVTKLWIDENGRGMGEAEILNTPAGRILKTLLEAGVRLYVSSRAYGSYKGKDPKGEYPSLDPDSYILETFDFVYDPGFLQAKPELVERLVESAGVCYDEFCKILNINNLNSEDKEVSGMSKDIVESLIKEKQMLAEELEKLNEENKNLKRKLEELTEEHRQLIELYNTREKEYSEAMKKLERLREFEKRVGSLDEVERTIVEAINKLEELKKFEERVGRLSDVEKVLDGSIKLLEDVMNFQRRVGTFDEIEESMNKAIRELKRLHEFQERVGPLEEVERVMVAMKAYLEDIIAEKERKKAEELARKYGVKESVIMKLKQKGMEFNEIEEIIKETNESISLKRRYSVPKRTNEDKKEDTPINEHLNDRLVRLAEFLSR